MKRRLTALVLVMALCAMGSPLQAQEDGDSILTTPTTDTETGADESAGSTMADEPLDAGMGEAGGAGNEPVRSEVIEKSGDVLELPQAPAGPPPPLTMPYHGMKMHEVERQFGTPLARHPAVGNPPIARWDYDGYSVFFEHSTVLHSVQQGRPAEIDHKDELLPAP